MAKEKFKFHVFLHRDGGDLELINITECPGSTTRSEAESLAINVILNSIDDSDADIHASIIAVSRSDSHGLLLLADNPYVEHRQVDSLSIDDIGPGGSDRVYMVYAHDFADYTFRVSPESPQDAVNTLKHEVAENYGSGIEVDIEYMFRVSSTGDLEMIEVPEPDEDFKNISNAGMR